MNLAAFAFTASAAIIGYGFNVQEPKPLIFLLPLLILGLLVVQLNNSVYTIFTISVFVRVFIEPEDEIPKWETNIGALRTLLRKKPFEGLKSYNPITVLNAAIYVIVAALMGVICLFLSLSFATLWYERLLIAISAILWGIICNILFRPLAFINSGKFEEECEIAFKLSKDKNGGKPSESSGTDTP